jgi:type IV secretory pathway TrbF-like protein
LAPWSWAADWVGDAGTLMKNVSLLNRDNLVMPYAYLMETKTVEVNYQLSGIRYKAYPGEQIFRQSFITEVKSRIQASPYGFDVDWPDLSGRQLGILGALGISKA